MYIYVYIIYVYLCIYYIYIYIYTYKYIYIYDGIFIYPKFQFTQKPTLMHHQGISLHFGCAIKDC